MSMTLRIIVVAVSLLTAVVMVGKIRRAQLRIEDAIFWFGLSLIFLIFSIFPRVPGWLSHIAGTQTTANFIYLTVIFLLITELFRMSLQLSRLEASFQELVQKLALEENRRRERREGDAQEGEELKDEGREGEERKVESSAGRGLTGSGGRQGRADW